MINAIQLPLHGGKLYRVDTRLRPNGNAGMLVSSMDSFADYQREHAWTWEHQALIRARCVCGPAALRERFDSIRHEVLARPRDPDGVRADLETMRRRQLKQRAEPGIKRVLGDIQFIAELGVLIHAGRHAELLDRRGTADQLAGLIDCGWLDVGTGRALGEVFHDAAALRDRLYLERDCDAVLPASAREAVRDAWRQTFESDAG